MRNAIKWTLFTLSLCALFVADNALFWLPGDYDWFNFVAAGVAIVVAAILAWSSGKRFATAKPTWKEIAKTPPVTIWMFVMLLFCFYGLARVIPRR